jgi:hypothetical protein
MFYTDYSGKAAWAFNGNMENPSFAPSMLIHGDDEETRKNKREWKDADGKGWPFPINLHCHSFVTDGKWQFLGDCEHELKGQTVEIPEWPLAAPEK